MDIMPLLLPVSPRHQAAKVYGVGLMRDRRGYTPESQQRVPFQELDGELRLEDACDACEQSSDGSVSAIAWIASVGRAISDPRTRSSR